MPEVATTDVAAWGVPSPVDPSSAIAAEAAALAGAFAVEFDIRRLRASNSVLTVGVVKEQADEEEFYDSASRGVSNVVGSAFIPQLVSESAFAEWAANAPLRLLAMIQSGGLRPADLTFAAEAAGEINDSIEVRRVLCALLTHGAPLVREGAIYGLVKHLDGETRSILEEVAGTDPSPGVREAAAESLEE